MPDVLKRVREMGKDRTERLAASTPKAMRPQILADLANDERFNLAA